MPGVQQIEDAVRKDDEPPAACTRAASAFAAATEPTGAGVLFMAARPAVP
jgi:hypothetical protein